VIQKLKDCPDLYHHMNAHTRYLLLLPILLTGLGFMLAGPVTAQTFTTLYGFTANGPNNTDGRFPSGGLTLSSNTLYGTAASGGTGDGGTVFALNTDGTGFATLYSFTVFDPNNGDGTSPGDGFILSGNTLYGTASGGGSSQVSGTVFAINTDGSGFTILYGFPRDNSSGYNPNSNLALSGNTLYGTAYGGGSGGIGTVFAVNTDGTGFGTLYSFTAIGPSITNSDGAYPRAGLILSGNSLYGTAVQGGTSDNGTVFALNTDGTGFTTLHSFTGTSIPGSSDGTNSDGANPTAVLLLSGNTLYGTATQGGTSGNGTVFALNTDGTGFTNLHSFTSVSNPYAFSSGTNSDGANPYAGLILSGNTLYGTAEQGGSGGTGTLFALNTDGTGFTTLYSFTALSPNYTNSGGIIYYTNSDGFGPSVLILSSNTLYGTAGGGGSGSSGGGLVFSLSFPTAPPQLTLTPSGPNVILTWPTNATGFSLQSTTTLGSAAVWTTNTPVPVVVNDQNVVTNPISGRQQFFRLSQ
jgi:uncharacterized repeat protein (TIGR03803 family)